MKLKLSASKQTRELTGLEYAILGFLAVKPQSGYAIINRVESGNYRWSASSGSIYPVLKRLEQQEIITSEIEAEYETRPRKVYSLLPLGEQMLDAWLRQPPRLQEVVEEYDIALHKFLIAEYRLSREEILVWLRDYERLIRGASAMQQVVNSSEHQANLTLHENLTNRSIELEINARLLWVQEASARLSSVEEKSR